MIKQHWPILFAILMVIISIILGAVALHSTDTGEVILVGVIIYMFLLPLAGAVIGGWYGWKLRSPLKWLIAPAAYLGVVLYLIVEDLISGADSMDIGASLSVGLFTGIACIAVEAISSAVALLVRKNKVTSEVERNGGDGQ